MANPYAPPSSDPTLPDSGGIDTTSPISPKGRFGRLSYIAWNMVLNIISYLILFAVGGAAIMAGSDPDAIREFFSTAGGAITLVISLISFVIYVIFGIRRLHDINKSGWLMLLLIIPLVNLIFMIYLLLARGTDGANRFGPARPTPGWEKILGYIGIGFMILALVFMVIGIIGMATTQM